MSKEYLIPYLASNAIAVLILWAAWRTPRWARWSTIFIFLAAGIFNAYTANTNPEAYLGYAPLAIPAYRQFINGWFAAHTQLMVNLIAVGQLLVALLLSLPAKSWFTLGIAGGIIFLLAITPLGMGSAFPCSLLLAFALYLIFRYYRKKLSLSAL